MAVTASVDHTDAGSGWDRTLGDPGRPDRVANALGRPIDTRDGVVRCLACHTTNVRFGRARVGPETLDAAIGCERCHGPGGNHVAAVAAGLLDSAIVNPEGAPTITVTRSCSECHVLDSEAEAPPSSRTDPGWIRSQGRTLSWSRCYTETDGGWDVSPATTRMAPRAHLLRTTNPSAFRAMPRVRTPPGPSPTTPPSFPVRSSLPGDASDATCPLSTCPPCTRR